MHWSLETRKIKKTNSLFRGFTIHQEYGAYITKEKAIELFNLIDNNEAEALRRLHNPRGKTKLHYDVVSYI